MKRGDLGLLDLDDVASALDTTPKGIRARMAKGQFPRGTRIGKKAYWRRQNVENWLDSHFASAGNENGLRRRPGRPRKD